MLQRSLIRLSQKNAKAIWKDICQWWLCHIYILSDYRSLACVTARHRLLIPFLNLNYHYAPSPPLRMRKAIILAYRHSVRASHLLFTSTLLQQRRATANHRNASQPASQLCYETVPAITARHRRLCSCFTSIADGNLEALCDCCSVSEWQRLMIDDDVFI